MNLSTTPLSIPAARQSWQQCRAFTLVEVLVSMVILAMMMLIITSVISQAQKSWRTASSRVTQFREARQAFETVTRNLRQATINSYRDYTFGAANTSVPDNPLDPPTGYKLQAQLGIKLDTAVNLVQGGGGSANLPGHAVIFQAPLGKTATIEFDPLNNLLCARGYFVMFGSDSDYVPRGLASRLQSKYRYRLMEYQPNTETNGVYGPTTGDWATINYGSEKDNIHPVAENIVMMALGASFTPATSGPTEAPDLASEQKNPIQYSYDSYQEAGNASSAYRLPHTVQVVMVAIDEASASIVAQKMGDAAPNPVGASGASFTEPTKLKEDLAKLTKYMQDQRINYRVFSSSVLILAAGS